MKTKKPKIRVYSTPSCPYCVMAKQFFKENKIEFEEFDVSRDRAAAQEMMEKSGQMGVPVIEIDEQIIIGFEPEAMKKILRLK
jgi:glutaredoxin-like YruB-family protein